MAFKPSNANNNSNNRSNADFNYPVPKGGLRKARVSLIVDLGTQEREDFEDPKTKATTPQKPCQQLAIFADLVNDVVDYGGEIGQAQYRLLLNKSYQGDVQGINFAATPPKDADGNMIEGKPWGWHPANILSKLAKAIEKPELIVSMDAEELLDGAFAADVEVTEKKTDKKDANGDEIVNKYVNLKGVSKVAPVEDDDGNEKPAPVAKLKQKARCVTFDNATADDIKFIRANLIIKIKSALNYEGSQMQKAIEELEASRSNNKSSQAESAAPVAAKPAKKKPVTNFSDMDDQIPF